MLTIKNLTAGYGGISAIREIDISVEQGAIAAIIGANGAGKSTLLKAVSGLVEKKAGRIVFNGKDIHNLPAERIVGLGLCQVAEGHQIFSHMTVMDNLELGAYLYHKRRHRREIRERTDQMFTFFPILERRAAQIAGTLSGGEQQMLAIARALMSRPKMLLLDEPSMGLAPIIVQEILEIVLRLKTMGMTILLVEQNAGAALRIADYAYVLETGRVSLEGAAHALAHDPKVKKAYLGG